MDFKSVYAGHITTSPGYCTQNCISRLSHSRKALMLENYRTISEWYDPCKTLTENLQIAGTKGIKVSGRTLQRYCSFNGIATVPGKIKASEWYNPRLSVGDNMQYAKENGIKTSRTSLYDYCKSNGINPKGMGD